MTHSKHLDFNLPLQPWKPYEPELLIEQSDQAKLHAIKLGLKLVGATEQASAYPHESNGAQLLLSAAILYVLYAEDEEKAIHRIYGLLAKPSHLIGLWQEGGRGPKDVREYVQGVKVLLLSSPVASTQRWIMRAQEAIAPQGLNLPSESQPQERC